MGKPLSEAHKAAISETRRKMFREDPGASKRLSEARRRLHLEQAEALIDAPPITERVCAGCNRRLPIEEFSTRKRKTKAGLITVRPESYCRECKAQHGREWRARKLAEGFDVRAYYRERYKERESRRTPAEKAEIRERGRERSAVRRRRAGVPPKNLKKYAQKRSKRVPIEPASVLLEVLYAEGHTKKEIALRSGVNPRRLYEIERLRSAHTELDVVDKLLIAFDRQDDLDELYPPEDEAEQLVGYAVLDPEGVLGTASSNGNLKPT